VILPITIAQEGWAMLKKFMDKHNYHPDWAYTLLAILIIFLLFKTNVKPKDSNITLKTGFTSFL